MKKALTGFLTEKITTVAMFDPEISIDDDKITYRLECETGGEFQCRATGLIFGMRDRGCVKYTVVHWDMNLLDPCIIYTLLWEKCTFFISHTVKLRVKKQHQEYTPIKTSSDCILRQKGKYCLTSSLKKYKVQPKGILC
ncbi:uncharacterized protein [Hoplias malabaricus]|uniref:uncharacterized protein n=1 Tax=Hoplias malabaricus TaxID=27720 RepID=UPI003463648D